MISPPSDWLQALRPFLADRAWRVVGTFLQQEYSSGQVFPAPENIFRAFELTPFSSVKAILLGQDPYHGDDQACGLAFSVPAHLPPPPSLRNILKEYCSDCGFPAPTNPSLTPWAQNGVLLLNTVLTVRAHQPGSHRGCGWEQITDAVIRALSRRHERPLAFILLGKDAQTKSHLIDSARHVIIKSSHPSPLSAHRGFLGSKIFTSTNRQLAALGATPINWGLDANQNC